MATNVLLTGNKGFIGGELEKSLINNPNVNKLFGYDDNSAVDWNRKFSRDLDKSCEPHERLSVLDQLSPPAGSKSAPQLRSRWNKIIHAGAISDSNCVDAQRIWVLNYESTRKIVDVCLSNQINLIYFSSCAALNPTNLYGISKYVAEQYIISNMPKYQYAIIRPYNIWGDESMKDNASIVYKMLTNNLKNVFEDCIRDFVHVSDVVRFVTYLCEKWTHGIFDFGTGIPTSILDLMNKLDTLKHVVTIPSGVANVSGYKPELVCENQHPLLKLMSMTNINNLSVDEIYKMSGLEI